MENKPFYIDSSVGLCKSYADLLRDAAAMRNIPNTYWSVEIYDIFTVLIAAICNDAEIALTQDSSIKSVDESVSLHAFTELSKLQSKITNSHCKIGMVTSGTTGRAKSISHSITTLTRSVRFGDRHREDIWGLAFQPTSFAGLQVFFQAICNGNTMVRLAGLDASVIHDAIERHAVTHISATPTMMRLMCSDGAVHAGVHQITTGGEVADKSLIRQIKSTFPNAAYGNIYASTECGTLLHSHGDAFMVPENLADRIKVIDGELAVHKSLLADSMKLETRDGFFATGDCVEVVANEPLTLRFTSRRGDWINVGGCKVNPHEVERMLVSMDGISDARVFGRKNSVTGNIVCCEIVRARGETISTADIRRCLEKMAASYMVPRIFEFVDVIGKTSTGKKSRSE